MVEKIEFIMTVDGKEHHVVFIDPEKILKLMMDKETSIGDFLCSFVDQQKEEKVSIWRKL